MRNKGGIHWENINTLLCWFSENLGQAFETILGDPDAALIKQQYMRYTESYEIYFKVLRVIYFPDERKNPYWTFWFGENYIMWVPPDLYSNKYYKWIKNKKTKQIHPINSYEFDRNRKIIGLNEIKHFFEFCDEKQLSKLPLIIFPNGKTFP
ncbi:hypothetical protein ES703_21839 [subsurface metagenome]